MKFLSLASEAKVLWILQLDVPQGLTREGIARRPLGELVTCSRNIRILPYPCYYLSIT